jgi:hypothetical protein
MALGVNAAWVRRLGGGGAGRHRSGWLCCPWAESPHFWRNHEVPLVPMAAFASVPDLAHEWGASGRVAHLMRVWRLPSTFTMPQGPSICFTLSG